MVNSSAMCAVTSTRVQWFVVYKPVKVLVYTIADHNFFGMCVDNSTSAVVWKNTLKTCRAVPIISSRSAAAIKPIYTVWASFTTTMSNTFIGLALSTGSTVRFNTTLATTMSNTFIGLALSTGSTVRFNTTLATTMSNTFVGLA
jgi:hypothetical protein